MNIPTSAQQICLCPFGEETWGWVRWSIAGVNSGAEDVLFLKCLDPLIFLPLMSEISFFRQWHWDQGNTRKPFSRKEYVCYKHLQRPWNQVTWITHTFLCFCFACGWQFQPLRKKKNLLGKKMIALVTVLWLLFIVFTYIKSNHNDQRGETFVVLMSIKIMACKPVGIFVHMVCEFKQERE